MHIHRPSAAIWFLYFWNSFTINIWCVVHDAPISVVWRTQHATQTRRNILQLKNSNERPEIVITSTNHFILWWLANARTRTTYVRHAIHIRLSGRKHKQTLKLIWIALRVYCLHSAHVIHVTFPLREWPGAYKTRSEKENNTKKTYSNGFGHSAKKENEKLKWKAKHTQIQTKKRNENCYRWQLQQIVSNFYLHSLFFPVLLRFILRSVSFHSISIPVSVVLGNIVGFQYQMPFNAAGEGGRKGRRNMKQNEYLPCLMMVVVVSRYFFSYSSWSIQNVNG